MTRIHANNYETTLASNLSAGALSMVVTSATGFPTIGSGVTCNLTIEDGSNIEIVTATARSGTTVTITRASESTSDLAWSSGATVSLRVTADSLDRKADGASSSTDNAVARYDSTTGKIIQNSGVIIDDSNNVSGLARLDVDNIRIDGNTISSTDSNGNISLLPNGSGAVTIGGNSTGPADLRLLEDSDNGSNYTGFKAPSSLAGNVLYTLPTADGTSGYYLQTNGSGTLTWAAASGSGIGDVVGPASSTDNGFARFDSTTGKLLQNTGTSSTLSDAGLAAFGSYLTLESGNVRIWSGSTVVTTSLGLGALSLNAQQAGGLQNTGCGYSSLRLLTTGDRNTAMGHTALDAVLTNSDNCAFGDSAFLAATGSNGVAVGSGCFSGITSGSQNVGLGVQVGTANASGAAGLTTAANNTLLGYRASADTNNTIGTIALGSDAVSTKATGATSGDDGPGIAIGSAAFPVGFRGDGTIYAAAGSAAGYWRVKINGTQYKIALLADA